MQVNQQQDVNEFNCLLCDLLEDRMKGTEVQGTTKDLFDGRLRSSVKCINVNFESTTYEPFSTLLLSVKGNKSIEESLREYVAPEDMVGADQYDGGDHGKQDARKVVGFQELPPVLQVSLNRFGIDMKELKATKDNSRLEFGEVLDLESVLPKGAVQSSQSQRNRFSQG